jgi:hypothetical protein
MIHKGFNEGYTKGIHDQDALTILQALIERYEPVDLLRYPSEVRAFAYLLWHHALVEEQRRPLQNQLQGAGNLLRVFPNGSHFDYLKKEIRITIAEGGKQVSHY